MLKVSATDLGTPEAAWLGSRVLATLPPLAWPGHGEGRVVVIAPHPDDEVLGLGGALLELARRGHEVVVVAVTDGEASHPRSPTTSRDAMAARRCEERAEALARLGLGGARIVRLRCADGKVAEDATLGEQLRPLLEDAALCFAPWTGDGHPDHDAAGRAALRAGFEAGVQVLEYPVWMWHWATDRESANAKVPRVPWERARRIELSSAACAAKRAAIAAYHSQIAPLSDAPGDEALLPEAVLARFVRPFEVVFA